jgi:hypothetical protein
MYTIEALPLAIDLDSSNYIPSADIEFVDAIEFVQQNLYRSAALLRFNQSQTKSSSVLLNSFVPLPLSVVSSNECSLAGSVERNLTGLPWGELSSIDKAAVISIERAAVFSEKNSMLPWGKLSHIDRVSTFLVESASVDINSGWDVGINSHLFEFSCVVDAPQFAVDLYSNRDSEYDLRQKDLFTSLGAVLNFDESPYVPNSNISWGNYQLTKLPAAPLSSIAKTSAYQPPAKDTLTVLPWGDGIPLQYSPELPYAVDDPEPVEPGEVPDANKRDVYLIMNNVNVFALPNNEPLAFADISIDLDLDSYSWKLTADVLNQQSIDLIKPDAAGNKEVAVEINGHRWSFFVPAWSRSRSISANALNKRYSITGYSRAQYLGLPYAPKRTRSIGSTTAVQAATDELVGTGFSLVWDVADLPDWVMPSSVFSYQELAALPVIKKLATTVGAIVQPAMDADTITVQPRYKVAPWDLATATVDRVIHENQILSEGGVLVSNSLINHVYVSGESEGVALNVTRNGTGGDESGTDIVDAWLSAVEANTSRGKHEIAASGDRINHSLELAIPESSAQPGLLLPGMIVEVQFNDSANNYRGYVQNNSISVPGRGLSKCRQSVVIEQPVGWES